MSYPDYPLVNELNKMLDEADTFNELNDALLYYDNLVNDYGKVTGHYGNKLSNGKLDCKFGEEVCKKVQEAQEKVESMRDVLNGPEESTGFYAEEDGKEREIKWSDDIIQNRLKALDSDYESPSSDDEAGAGAGAKKGGRRRRRKSKKRKKKKKKKTRKKRKKRKTRKKRKLRKKKRRKTNRK